MRTFSSIDLQKQSGDVQRAASREGAVITSHGKPRNVMLSVEELRRLKLAAGEVPPYMVEAKPVVIMHQPDPLGYDVRNFPHAARQMAEDAIAGRNEASVSAELDALRHWLRDGIVGAGGQTGRPEVRLERSRSVARWRL